jgi:hypothetical protein
MLPTIEIWPIFAILVFAIAFGLLIAVLDTRMERNERRGVAPTQLRRPASQQNLKRSA